MISEAIPCCWQAIGLDEGVMAQSVSQAGNRDTGYLIYHCEEYQALNSRRFPFTDCAEIYKMGHKYSGIYTIRMKQNVSGAKLTEITL